MSDRRQRNRRDRQRRVWRNRRREERRRRERRADPRISVQISVDEETSTETTFHLSGNLSTGGIYLSSGLPRPRGTQAKLRFHLPGDNSPVEVVAEVVASNTTDNNLGTRLRFVDLQPTDHQRILAFIGDHTGGS